jgi:hypothetical protein
MKHGFPSITSLAFVLVTAGSIVLMGQTPAPTSNADQASNKPASGDEAQESGVVSYLRRTVKLSGSIRERWEATDGPFSVTPADSYVLSQERLGLSYQPSSWLHFMLEAQDARVFLYNTTPSNLISNPIDLHLA